MTSLKDIAKRLNVSTTTVSWTLSGQGDKKGISRKTQERVLACAEEMRYKPNLLARGFNTGRSDILGIIIPDITDSFYSVITRQVELEAEKKGFSLMICNSVSDQSREDRMLDMFRAKQVDGIIIASVKHSEKKLLELSEEDYPLVTFDRVFQNMDFNSIMIDNRRASRNIVSGMISRGARHIAILTTNPHLYTMNERFEGYKDALESSGIGFEEALVGNVPFEGYEESMTDVLDRIYQLAPDVDGFFFTTHILAIEAFRYFFNRRIDVNVGYQLGCIHGVPAFRALAPGIRVAV